MPATPSLSAAAFAAKWKDNARRERASSQEHFIDLCRLLSLPTPNEAGAARTSSGKPGWADVWKRGHFGWEYKGAPADLAADSSIRRKQRGRPPKPMPEPIPDTPESVLRALLDAPPRKKSEWKYLQQQPEESAEQD